MQSVYIVLRVDTSSFDVPVSDISGVFATREDAIAYVNSQPNNPSLGIELDIEEHAVTEFLKRPDA